MAIRTPLTRATAAGTGYPTDHDVANDGLDLGNAAQLSGDLTFDSGGEPRGLPTTPGASDAASSKAYVDAVAVQSRAWKEVLLVKEQVLNGASGGVLQAILAALSGQPTANDTFILTDGTTTETFTFKATEAAAFDVAIGATAADTLANLVQAINDDSTLWSAVDTTGLDAYFAAAYANQAVIYRTAVSTASDRAYGSITGSVLKVVEFDNAQQQDYDIAAGTEQNLPSADPTTKTFGFGRVKGSLATNETHPIAEDITAWTWDTDDEIWRQTDSSAIQGGPGISRSGSVISTDLDTTAAETGAGQSGGSSGLEYDTTGNAGKLRVSVSATGAIGRKADGIGIRLPATNPGLQITSNELDAKLDGTRGLAKDASGQYVKVDGSTITFDGGGQLQATTVASEAQRIENDLPVSAAVAIGDVVEFRTTNDQIAPCDAGTDAETQCIGVATTAQSTVGQNATIVSIGLAAGVISGATVGTPYYLQDGGGIGTAIPTGNKRVVLVGYAKNANDLWVEIQDFGKKF